MPDAITYVGHATVRADLAGGRILTEPVAFPEMCRSSWHAAAVP